MNTLNRYLLPASAVIAALMMPMQTMAQQFSCSTAAERVTAITETKPIILKETSIYNPMPSVMSNNLQTVLKTEVTTLKTGCMTAHLSGLAKIMDNYMVFQILVDGVPMLGQEWDGLNYVASVSTDALSYAPYDDEQHIDPLKVFSYNMFAKSREGRAMLPGGTHTIEVLAGAGSNIDPDNLPYIRNLVLTLEHP